MRLLIIGDSILLVAVTLVSFVVAHIFYIVRVQWKTYNISPSTKRLQIRMLYQLFLQVNLNPFQLKYRGQTFRLR